MDIDSKFYKDKENGIECWIDESYVPNRPIHLTLPTLVYMDANQAENLADALLDFSRFVRSKQVLPQTPLELPMPNVKPTLGPRPKK